MLLLEYAIAAAKYLTAVLLALALPVFLIQDSITASLGVMIVLLWVASRYGKRQFRRVGRA